MPTGAIATPAIPGRARSILPSRLRSYREATPRALSSLHLISPVPYLGRIHRIFTGPPYLVGCESSSPQLYVAGVAGNAEDLHRRIPVEQMLALADGAFEYGELGAPCRPDGDVVLTQP